MMACAPAPWERTEREGGGWRECEEEDGARMPEASPKSLRVLISVLDRDKNGEAESGEEQERER